MKCIIFIYFSHFQSTLPLQCGHGLQNKKALQSDVSTSTWWSSQLCIHDVHPVPPAPSSGQRSSHVCLNSGCLFLLERELPQTSYGTNQHVGVTAPRGCRWSESFSSGQSLINRKQSRAQRCKLYSFRSCLEWIVFVRSSVLMPNLLGVNQAVPRTSDLPDAGFLISKVLAQNSFVSQ